MTNDFQGGVTASDLSPQTYKNSNQAPGIQSTLDSSDIESSLSQSVNTLPATGKLVVVGPNPSTLGVSTQPVSQPQSSTNYLPLALISVVVFAILTVYFLSRYRKLSTTADE